MSSLEQHTRLPSWLRRPPASDPATVAIKQQLRRGSLNTVCEEARCPNIAECFSRGTATFMILGDVCTRGCRFCSVTTGKPAMPSAAFDAEAQQLAETAAQLDLRHVVVTSVARDDLPDGGAEGFVKTIAELRKQVPGVSVEVLVPDFRGEPDALQAVLDAGPDVLNHNLETVPRLYRRVRPGSSYRRSLELLQSAKQHSPKLITKTGIMLGLGEREDEVLQLMRDCVEHSIDTFTAGQYLRPTREHLEVEAYIEPAQFARYQAFAEEVGFIHAAIGPLVRSSYRADEFIDAVHARRAQADYQ